MASTLLGGILIFKVNGTQYSLAGSFSYDIGGITREMRNGPDGTHGSVGKYREAMIDCELQDGPDVSLAAIQAIDGQTLTAEMGNGKTFVLMNATQVGDLPVDVVEAKIKVKFGGITGQEFT